MKVEPFQYSTIPNNKSTRYPWPHTISSSSSLPIHYRHPFSWLLFFFQFSFDMISNDRFFGNWFPFGLAITHGWLIQTLLPSLGIWIGRITLLLYPPTLKKVDICKYFYFIPFANLSIYFLFCPVSNKGCYMRVCTRVGLWMNTEDAQNHPVPAYCLQVNTQGAWSLVVPHQVVASGSISKFDPQM